MFSGLTQSACGRAQSAWPRFIVPMTNRVYLDISFFRDLEQRFRGCSGKACQFTQAYVISHEIGSQEWGWFPRFCVWALTRMIEMSRGFPSMTALLGLLAVAGYQNRDKLAEILSGAQQKLGAPGTGSQPGQGGLLDNLGGLLSGTTVGGLLTGGLRDLTETFKQKGQGEVGLTKEQLLAKLSSNLPDAVDKYTPEGRLPAAA